MRRYPYDLVSRRNVVGGSGKSLSRDCMLVVGGRYGNYLGASGEFAVGSYGSVRKRWEFLISSHHYNKRLFLKKAAFDKDCVMPSKFEYWN